MPIEVIVLAAGQGTRMKSPLPKVIHEVGGVPMLELLLRELDCAMAAHQGASFNIVVGHGREAVMAKVQALAAGGGLQAPLRFTVQHEQKGTGHALKLALEGSEAPLVAVFNGDLPLFTGEAFAQFLEVHRKSRSVASLISMVLPDGGAYGRILRKGKAFSGTVEYKDATPAQRRVREVNSGVYLFDRAFLEASLPRLSSRNKSGEYYLPDLFNLAIKGRKKALAHALDDVSLLTGVNNMVELAEAGRMLRDRVSRRWMVEGVQIIDPAATYIGPYVAFGKGCVVMPGSVIEGRCRFADGVRIGPHCHLKDVEAAEGAVIKAGVVADGARIGARVAVGPMAHFRPGTVIGEDAKVGNFVEVKASTIGAKSAVSHLSYVGDAEVGKRVNIGCGFVTCNYDGKSKHKSVIGDDVFIGSDSQVVAPISIAEGTYVGSGSTVTDSVTEPHSLVIARAKQVTKPGYARKYAKKG